MFAQHGTVVEIVAMKSFWRRGQAFVAFRDLEHARAAMQALQGHMYEGKPLRINFAKEESDVFKREKGEWEPRPKGPKKPRAIRERESALQRQFEQLQEQMLTFQERSVEPPSRTEPVDLHDDSKACEIASVA